MNLISWLLLNIKEFVIPYKNYKLFWLKMIKEYSIKNFLFNRLIRLSLFRSAKNIILIITEKSSKIINNLYYLSGLLNAVIFFFLNFRNP